MVTKSRLTSAALCMFVVIVGVCAVLYVKFGISPKNWLGYWGLMTAISGMAKGRLAEAVAPILREALGVK